MTLKIGNRYTGSVAVPLLAQCYGTGNKMTLDCFGMPPAVTMDTYLLNVALPNNMHSRLDPGSNRTGGIWPSAGTPQGEGREGQMSRFQT